jgi:hypothetical protein
MVRELVCKRASSLAKIVMNDGRCFRYPITWWMILAFSGCVVALILMSYDTLFRNVFSTWHGLLTTQLTRGPTLEYHKV